MNFSMYFILPHKHLHLGLVQNEVIYHIFLNVLLRSHSFLPNVDQNWNFLEISSSIYKTFNSYPSHSCILNAAYLALMYSTQWEIQTKVEIIWWGKSTNSSHPTAKRNAHEYSSQTDQSGQLRKFGVSQKLYL